MLQYFLIIIFCDRIITCSANHLLCSYKVQQRPELQNQSSSEMSEDSTEAGPLTDLTPDGVTRPQTLPVSITNTNIIAEIDIYF